MKARLILVGALLVSAFGMIPLPSAEAYEMTPYQMMEDSGHPSGWDAALQYYYYVPAPTYSWFWGCKDFEYGDVLGVWFELWDVSQGGFSPSGRPMDNTLIGFRVLDFAGYGTVYPGLFTVDFDVWCADEWGCPIPGSHRWGSGPTETHFGWNYVEVSPEVGAWWCVIPPGQMDSPARMLVTAHMIGTESFYPEWGLDNVSSPELLGLEMHDSGCLPALYPRPYVGYYPAVHTGYYGEWFTHCPPLRILDGRDSTTDGSRYGAVELAWRFYFETYGPCSDSSTVPASWEAIKQMYR